MSQSRQLAATMFTDIVGYTALMQKDEQQALIILNNFKNIVERHTPNHQGQVVQYYGDGCLVSFLSSANCVSCALALQKEFRGFHPIPVRIGLHLGEVVFKNNNVFGEGVNLASRVESSAGVIKTQLFACSIDNLSTRTIFV
jgi:class 3 adenylate cyclase